MAATLSAQGNAGAAESSLQRLEESVASVGVPREAALRVVKGSAGLSAVAGIGGMVYGVLKAQPAVLYGFAAGGHTFAYTFPIFALREYVVGPLLRSAQEEQRQPAAVPSMHTHNIAATAISSAVGGMAMRTYLNGRPRLTGRGGLISGALTFALVGAGLQLAANEVRIVRIRMVSRYDDDVQHQTRPHEGGFLSNLKEGLREPIKPRRELDPLLSANPFSVLTTDEDKDATLRSADPTPLQGSVASEPSSATQTAVKALTWIDKAWNTVASYSPVKKISDEEYEKRLLDQREQKLEQLRELDREIAAEEQRNRQV